MLVVLAVGASLFLVHAGLASAAQNPFCLPGSGAGQCSSPNGIATDFESGDVYVADTGNDRVNVFETDGDPSTPASIGAGQLESPSWVAVDNDTSSASQGDIWVTTQKGQGAALLVKKFEPDGTFVEADSFDSASEGEGGKGECEFQANDPIAVGPGGNVYVADSYDKGGSVFVNRAIVFDTSGTCLEEIPLFEESNQAIRNFAVDSTGHIYVTVAGGGGVIRKYSPTGTLEHQFEVLETEGLAVDAADNLFAKQRGQTVIPAIDTLYFFTEYAPSTAILKRFDYVIRVVFNVPALAAFHSAEGDLYSSQGAEGVRYRKLPEGPALTPRPCQVKGGAPGNTHATLQAEVNPEGKATNFFFEYVTQAEFEAEGFASPQKSLPAPLGGTADFELHVAEQKVEGLEAETVYHCRARAVNADGESAPGEEGTFKTSEGFEFGGAWTTGVTETSANVFAEGNPHGLAATGQIEYVTDAQYQASGFAEALSAPTPEIDFGSSEEMQLRSAGLSGLLPGTLYHYRLRARNGSPPEGIICPERKEVCPELERTFRTFSPGTPDADQRRYELVSPGQKNSAEVGVPGNLIGFVEPRTVQIQAGATNGEAITYTSWTSFGSAEGAPATSQYLSRRAGSGWATENISPFGVLDNPLFPPYGGFNPELTLATLKTREPPLVPGCRQSEGIYLRDLASGALRCLNPEAPGSPVAPCLVYGGASSDGSRAFLAGRPEGGKIYTYSLYESTAGGLAPVSIMPNEEAAPATHGTAFGPGGDSFSGAENCEVSRTILRHAISADGSRAFWTFVPEDDVVGVTSVGPGVRTLTIEAPEVPFTFTLGFRGATTSAIASNASAATIQTALASLSTIGAGKVEVSGANPFTITFKGSLAGTTDGMAADPQSQLLVRIDGTKTEQLDKKRGGGSGEGEGVFVGANTDGSIAYFLDEEKLIGAAKAAPGKADLYRYEVGKAVPLTDLTAGGPGPGDVKGIAGISDDGSYVYFVAGGALAPGAVEGENNLYLFHEGQTRFIASLAGEDSGVWVENPREMAARVTPDGRHLAFLSIEAEELANYDNEIATGEHCKYSYDPTADTQANLTGSPLCPQAFIYDADTDELTCATCNPAGSRPLGPTVIPGWSNGFEGPRFLSDDGQRLFFASLDVLVNANLDVNGRLDVYEFERAGKGACGAANPGFDPKTAGCHFLVSTGKSSDESFFIDASADGRDVFFSTRQILVGWDVNENFDVYDYREGGGFPEPSVPPPPCEGEASCVPPASTPPAAPNPATPGFNGPGNEKPKKAKKKHKKGKKHKKKKSKGKGKKKQGKKGKANKKGRAGR